MDRAQALALLEEAHTFPGPYRLRVVVPGGGTAGVVSAVSAVVGDRLLEVDERPSRAGRWVSVRIAVHAASAEEVLDLYEVVRAIEGVVATM